MDEQQVYDRARKEVRNAESWAGIVQGAVFQGLESFPEQMEKVPGLYEVPEKFFHELLNPVGDKFVHLGAFYSGSLLTMRGMDYGIDRIEEKLPEDHPLLENREEALMAGAFLATTAAGSGIEIMDPYFDMMDMAANYSGSYLACERYLEEGPTERIYDFIEGRAGEESLDDAEYGD
jgi:hypothetical protein